MELTLSRVEEILKNISFKHSCVDMDWKWRVVEIESSTKEHDENGVVTLGVTSGFLINTTFKRPDINNGVMGVGSGRQMWIPKEYSEMGVIMTAWLCAELIVKHELMESFQYGGATILNPHKKIDELAYPETLKRIE